MAPTFVGAGMIAAALAAASTAPGQSPQVAVSSLDHLTTWAELPDGSWQIRHTKNIDGEFILFRNRTPDVLTVTLGDGGEEHLAPRESATWDCRVGLSGGTLAVGTANGDSIYSTRVECGDAVAARTHFPSGETLAAASGEPAAAPSSLPAIVSPGESGAASVEQTHSTVRISGVAWSIRHAGNADGTFMLLRNAAGGPVVSVIKDGGAPIPLVPRETVTWPCKGPGEIDALIVVQAEGGGIVHTGLLECGDALYIGGDGGGG